MLIDSGWRYQKNVYKEFDIFGLPQPDKVFYTYKFIHYDVYDKKGLDFNDPKYASEKYTIADFHFRIAPT